VLHKLKRGKNPTANTTRGAAYGGERDSYIWGVGLPEDAEGKNGRRNNLGGGWGGRGLGESCRGRLQTSSTGQKDGGRMIRCMGRGG